MTYLYAFIIGFVGFILGIAAIIRLRFNFSASTSRNAGLLIPLLLVLVVTLLFAKNSFDIWNYVFLVIVTLIPIGFASFGLLMNLTQHGTDDLGFIKGLEGSDLGRLNGAFVAASLIGCFVSVVLFPLIRYFIS